MGSTETIKLDIDTSRAERKLEDFAKKALRSADVLKPSPGYKTTEFWVTLAMMLLSALTAADVISPADSIELEGQASEMGDLIVKLSGLVQAVAYIISRTLVKVRNP